MLQEGEAPAKPLAPLGNGVGLGRVPRLSAGAVRLLDLLAVPIHPEAVLRLPGRRPGRRVLMAFSDPTEAVAAQAELSSRGHPLASAVRVLPSSHPAEDRIWLLIGMTEASVLAAAEAAEPLPTLIRRNGWSEVSIYARAALVRRLRFEPDLSGYLPSGTLPSPGIIAGLSAARFADAAGRLVTVLAPPLERLETTLRAAMELSDSAAPVVLTTPRSLQSAFHRAMAAEVLGEAVTALARRDPQLSAGDCPRPRERALILGTLAAVPAALLAAPEMLATAALSAASLVFLTLGVLRLMAGLDIPPARPVEPLPDRDLPSYTVLVALYDEAQMVGELLDGLCRLDYPRDRLEILVLVETADRPTRAAADRACAARPWCRVIVVPPGLPRTKPRALAYGAAFARGDIVTVYDAEDRPHPHQLRVAAAALVRGPDELACVQARLEIDRIRNGLQAQFAIEYAALFDGFLPWLGARGAPLPLGGTSNHFKRHALLAAHGWDPYNVTEDADLGIRLMRYGFRADVIDSATREAAPATVAVWRRQRVRWLKGWLVTWLVHTRNPRQLAFEIGRTNAVLFHAQSAVAVLSPLCHPFGLLLPVLYLLGVVGPPIGSDLLADFLAALGASALIIGYGGAIALARKALRRRGRTHLLGRTWLLPAYWLLTSWAAWLAIFDLMARPHYWAKTAHEPSSPGDEPGVVGAEWEGLERVKGIEPSS